MANLYVDSNATGLNDGTSWTDAWTSIESITGNIAAGDDVWIASDHSETKTAAALTATTATSASLPNRLLSADKTSGTPPTTLQAGASIATGSAQNIDMIHGGTGLLYAWGITFDAADALSFQNFWNLENCELIVRGGDQLANVVFSGAGARVLNCTIGLMGSQSSIRLEPGTGYVEIIGGGLLTSSNPDTIFYSSQVGGNNRVLVQGFDMSNAPSDIDMQTYATTGGSHIIMRNCRLPASWTGELQNTHDNVGQCTVKLNNCDNGATEYNSLWGNNWGLAFTETTIVKDDGTSNQVTPTSVRIETRSGSINRFVEYVDLIEIPYYNLSTGSSVTASLDFIHDSLTALQDDEIWLEAMYLSASGASTMSLATGRLPIIGTSASNHASSAATWTTTGMTNPNEQRMSISFTPQEVGFFFIRAVVCKPSYTVYIDPELIIS